MAGSSESEEGDFWPGYVDALTSMVKVLTFIMMLLAVTVSVISQQIAVSGVKKLAEAAGIEVSENQKFEEIIETVTKQLRESRTKGEQVKDDKPPEQVGNGAPEQAAPTTRTASNTDGTQATAGAHVGPQSTSASVKHNTPKQASTGKVRPEESKEQTLILKFDPRAIAIDDDGKAAIKTFIERVRSEGARHFTVRSTVSTAAPSISEARRVSYQRMMLIRQTLMELKLTPAEITMLMDEPGEDVPEHIITIEAR